MGQWAQLGKAGLLALTTLKAISPSSAAKLLIFSFSSSSTSALVCSARAAS